MYKHNGKHWHSWYTVSCFMYRIYEVIGALDVWRCILTCRCTGSLACLQYHMFPLRPSHSRSLEMQICSSLPAEHRHTIVNGFKCTSIMFNTEWETTDKWYLNFLSLKDSCNCVKYTKKTQVLPVLMMEQDPMNSFYLLCTGSGTPNDIQVK